MAQEGLRELANAWRGDHSNFDARLLEDQLDDIALMIDGDLNIEDFSENHNLCPFGHGHWKAWCEDYNCWTVNPPQ